MTWTREKIEKLSSKDFLAIVHYIGWIWSHLLSRSVCLHDSGWKSRWLCLKALLFLPAPFLYHYLDSRYIFCPLLSKILCPRNPNLNPWNLPICCILQALACFFSESDFEGQDQRSVLMKTPEKSSCCNGLDSNEALNLQNGAIRVGFTWDVANHLYKRHFKHPLRFFLFILRLYNEILIHLLCVYLIFLNFTRETFSRQLQGQL